MKKTIFMLSFCSIIQSCTFGTLVDPEKSTNYFIKYGEICYDFGGGALVSTKINADRKSFIVLSEAIGKDKKTIYYKGKPQNNVDYPTFIVDQNGVPKDKNHVYAETYSHGLEPIPIPEVDIESFQYLEISSKTYPRWAKDKNWYYLGNARVSTDYESTRFIGDNFLYDKTKLYIHFNKPPYIKFVQAITEPPKTLTKKYIQYKSKLYYLKTSYKEGNQIIEIDFRTIYDLKIINDHVMTINGTVVYYGTEKPHFDAATFEKIKDNELSEHIRYYKDKNAVYLDAKVIQLADPKTFTMLSYSLAKDDKYVFYKEKILTGADPKSFRKGKNQEWIDDRGNRFDSNGNKIVSVKQQNN